MLPAKLLWKVVVLKKEPHGKGNAPEDPKGLQFSAIVDLQIGGNAGMIQIIDDTKLAVESSDWAVLVPAASSSFEGPFTKPSDSKKDHTLHP